MKYALRCVDFGVTVYIDKYVEPTFGAVLGVRSKNDIWSVEHKSLDEFENLDSGAEVHFLKAVCLDEEYEVFEHKTPIGYRVEIIERPSDMGNYISESLTKK